MWIDKKKIFWIRPPFKKSIPFTPNFLGQKTEMYRQCSSTKILTKRRTRQRPLCLNTTRIAVNYNLHGIKNSACTLIWGWDGPYRYRYLWYIYLWHLFNFCGGRNHKTLMCNRCFTPHNDLLPYPRPHEAKRGDIWINVRMTTERFNRTRCIITARLL